MQLLPASIPKTAASPCLLKTSSQMRGNVLSPNTSKLTSSKADCPLCDLEPSLNLRHLEGSVTFGAFGRTRASLNVVQGPGSRFQLLRIATKHKIGLSPCRGQVRRADSLHQVLLSNIGIGMASWANGRLRITLLAEPIGNQGHRSALRSA